MIESDFLHAIGDWSAPVPHARLRIYRNNVVSALSNALKVRFPVTAQLVGNDFFKFMAATFASEERPMSPVLIRYGERFPDFIADFEPAGSVPYLADVAALENIWWKAYHAADRHSLAASQLENIQIESWIGSRPALHPSLGMITSQHAILSIWQAHRGGPSMGSFALDTPQSVIAIRPEATVQLHEVDSATLYFVSSLVEGMSLLEAVETASGAFPGFDINHQIGRLFSLGMIVEFLQ